MKNGLLRNLDEAIRLELHVAEIYTLYSQAYPEDAEFWQQLAGEEKNHAALLKKGRQAFMAEEELPADLIPEDPLELVETNNWLRSLLAEFSRRPPSRESAFMTALVIEGSAGEIHYQKAMVSPTDSIVMKMFQALNGDDIDHLSRVRSYMKEKDIFEAAAAESFCEMLVECLFFNDKLENMPAVAGVMKKKFCQGSQQTTCARYMVAKTMGKEKVPADLFPHDSGRAKRILSLGGVR